MIYTLDHMPPHVHVIGGKGEAVFLLRDSLCLVELRESFGVSDKELAEIENELISQFPALVAAWRRIHD